MEMGHKESKMENKDIDLYLMAKALQERDIDKVIDEALNGIKILDK